MKKIALSTIVALGLSGAAMAGGDIAPVVPAPADSWSGFYVGLQAGGVWGDADLNFVADNGDRDHANGLSVDGFAGGIYGGYNWLLENNWLLGVEGEWNYISADNTKDSEIFQFHTKVEQNWDASLRLRAGKVMGDYLPYITGGIAWGDFDVSAYGSGWGTAASHGSYTLTGWTIGAGLEMKLTENLHARIQYRYTDYGDDTKRIRSDVEAKLDYNAHMLMVGISYRF